jgi:hypothetical protein
LSEYDFALSDLKEDGFPLWSCSGGLAIVGLRDDLKGLCFDGCKDGRYFGVLSYPWQPVPFMDNFLVL